MSLRCVVRNDNLIFLVGVLFFSPFFTNTCLISRSLCRVHVFRWLPLLQVRQWPGNGADLDFRGVIARCKATIIAAAPAKGSVSEGVLEEIGFGGETGPEALVAYKESAEYAVLSKTLAFVRLWCIGESRIMPRKKAPHGVCFVVIPPCTCVLPVSHGRNFAPQLRSTPPSKTASPSSLSASSIARMRMAASPSPRARPRSRCSRISRAW